MSDSKQRVKIYAITKDDSFAVAKINQYEQIIRFNGLAGYVKVIVREDLYGK